MNGFVRLNQAASRWIDRFLPCSMRVDGNREFASSFAQAFITSGMTVYDVGGGKNPLLDLERKTELKLRYVGLDIDAEELGRARPGVYDEVIATDVSTYGGRGDGNVVICRALLEHVENIEEAFSALASILKPGGRLILFVPSRNAIFARINLLLPQRVKRFILFTIFPSTSRNQGFPSFYRRCTPRDFKALAEVNGLVMEEVRTYWSSMYFSFFVPLHAVWRLTQLVMRLLFRNQAAETYSMALVKR